MNTVYVVYTEEIEAFYIHGVFTSKEELEKGLEELSKDSFSLKQAVERREDSKKWYYKTHLLFMGVDRCQDGCEHKPYSLTVDLQEYSKSLYHIYEIKTNQSNSNPLAVGYE